MLSVPFFLNFLSIRPSLVALFFLFLMILCFAYNLCWFVGLDVSICFLLLPISMAIYITITLTITFPVTVNLTLTLVVDSFLCFFCSVLECYFSVQCPQDYEALLPSPHWLDFPGSDGVRTQPNFTLSKKNLFLCFI